MTLCDRRPLESAAERADMDMSRGRKHRGGTMAAISKRDTPLAELFDWFDAGWPALAEWRREMTPTAIRIEDRLEEDRYIVRAELPGLDPEKDITITVDNGILTVAAEREEKVTEKGRSEFRYGSFIRRVTLPPGTQEDAVDASYKDGILEVSMPVAGKPEPRRIPVARKAKD
jgi:HSP20 family molecular chaperone IbpA